MAQIKGRPILFSAPMVRAILASTKTQTRRVVKPQPYIDGQGNFCWNGSNFGQDFNGPHIQAIASPIPSSKTKRVHCPYGKPGDRLWVRETWQHSNFPLGPYDESCTVFYRADYLDDPHGPDGEKSPEGKYRHWAPSIHMPRWASRILLEITGVRVERLQDISAIDAKKEGIEGQFDDGPWRNYQRDGFWFPEGKDTAPTLSYCSLWESINGPGSWDANPWVWAIEFRRVEQ